MSGKAIVATVKTYPHPNADNIQLGDVLGFQVVIGKDVQDGDVGVFFMEGLQLSEEYAEKNNLVRKKCPETGKNIGGFFEETRRVRAQKFRGEKSEGYFSSLKSLEYTGLNESLKPGHQFSELNGYKICDKYFTPATFMKKQRGTKFGRGQTTMFYKHFDMEQIRFNMYKIKHGRTLTMTLKIHGTSQRTGYVLDERPKNWWQRLLGKIGIDYRVFDWTYMTGSRNVILDNLTEGFRYEAARNFEGKLYKGETVFYEIVGWESPHTPIMPAHKTKDKELVKLWGEEIIYDYGCARGAFEVYVYRITMTNTEGHSVDLPWYAVKKRCGEMGVKHVPEISEAQEPHFVINDAEHVKDWLNTRLPEFADGKDLIGNHPREGVCIRVDDEIFKYKSFTFGVLEGYIKNDENYVDAEEIS